MKKSKLIDITTIKFLIVGVINTLVGTGSFPNKRILRNNLCLPACKLLYLTNEKKLSIDRNNVKYYNCL